MSVTRFSTIITPAPAADLTVLANVKLDMGINSGRTFLTSADTASGAVLLFTSTDGAAKNQTVTGPNISVTATVQALTATSLTLSAPVLGDVPAGAAIVVGADASIDAFLARAITLSSQTIANYCDKQFNVETIQDQFLFQLDPYSCQITASLTKLLLTKTPLVSITSVTLIDDFSSVALVAGTDFTADDLTGQLTRLDSSTGKPCNWWAVQTVVVYTAGYPIIPADVDDACSRLVKRAFHKRGRDPSVMEQSGQTMGNQKFWVNENALPPEISNLLDNYRVPSFA